MTTQFQWIIDNCSDLQINKRAVVAQTVSRDQTIRGVSRGGNVWRFVVTPSPGIWWNVCRGNIEAMDKADRHSVTQINFATSGHEFIYGYQGNVVGTQSMTYTQGSDTITVSGGAIGSGYRFKAGDLIQPTGSARVYAVVNDVPYNSTSVLLNRPILDASGTANAIVGKDCTWSVVCTQYPEYKIVAPGRVEWSSTFTFMESLA